MEEQYAADELAGLARATAQEVGWEAVRWWQDLCDPRFLYIEAKAAVRFAQPMLITLQAFLD
jgi:hypothetical protein